MKRLLSLSDIELIKSMQAGHEKAFDVLLQRYMKDIRNVVQHYTKDGQLTEDLSQDVLIKIYTSIKENKYNEQGKFLPWSLRIARNLCLDHLRKASQFPRCCTILHDDYLGTSVKESAENRMVAQQQELQLNVFINRMLDAQKKVVCYRYFEELSFKEIAELMNTNVNTTMARMRYGLTHLRKQVANTPAFL